LLILNFTLLLEVPNYVRKIKFVHLINIINLTTIDPFFSQDEITTLVGALMGKQQGFERSACAVGWRSREIAAREVFLM